MPVSLPLCDFLLEMVNAQDWPLGNTWDIGKKLLPKSQPRAPSRLRPVSTSDRVVKVPPGARSHPPSSHVPR